MKKLLYFEEYNNIARDVIDAIQFTEENKNLISNDMYNSGVKSEITIDEANGQSVLAFVNPSDGVKQFATIGSYIAYTPVTEFIVIEKNSFEENMTKKGLN